MVVNLIVRGINNMQSVSPDQKYIPLVPVLSILAALIPIYFCFTIYTGGDPVENTIFVRGLTSNGLENAMICSISITAPIILEYLLDSTVTRARGHSFRVVRTCGLLIPNIIIIAGVHDPAIQMYIPCILCIQNIVYIYCMIAILNNANPNIFTYQMSLFIGCMLSTSTLLCCFAAYSSSSITIFYAGYVLVAIAMIFSLPMIFIWIKKIIKNYNNTEKWMRSEEFSVSIQFIEFLLLVFIGRLILNLYYGFIDWKDTPAEYICVRTYVDTFLLLGYTLINDRFFRKELQFAQNTLEVKRAFVNYISHEMRTPLNTIFLGLKLLQDDLILNDDPPSRIEIVEDLKTSCDVTLSILNEMLTFDKLESGMLKVELSMIPVWDFISSTIKPFEIQAQHGGVILQFADEAMTSAIFSTIKIEGDENKLAQVLRNFVSNALKFTPRGGTVTIRLSISSRDCADNSPVITSTCTTTTAFTTPSMTTTMAAFSIASGDTKFPYDTNNNTTSNSVHTSNSGGNLIMSSKTPVKTPKRMLSKKFSRMSFYVPEEKETKQVEEMLKIEVIDTGAGISEENQKKVFREVIQFHPGRLQKGGGSGLGLYITKGIVELHKGTVSVFSAGEGHGCTFTVELPLPKTPSLLCPTPKFTATSTSAFLSNNNNAVANYECNTSRSMKLQPHSARLEPLVEKSNNGTSSTSTSNLTRAMSYKRCLSLSHTSHITSTPTPVVEHKFDERTERISPIENHNHNNYGNGNGNKHYSFDDDIFNDNDIDTNSSHSHNNDNDEEDKESTYSHNTDIANIINNNNNNNTNKRKGSIWSSSNSSFSSSKSSPVVSPHGNINMKIKLNTNTNDMSSSNDNNFICRRIQRVLIVDDSNMNRKMLYRHLKNTYDIILEAENGVDAVNIIKESNTAGTPINIVLMDHQMPLMDGPTATKAMRDMGYKGLIIGVTGNASAVEREIFLSHGADHMLTKPLNTLQLDKIIKEYNIVPSSPTPKPLQHQHQQGASSTSTSGGGGSNSISYRMRKIAVMDIEDDPDYGTSI